MSQFPFQAAAAAVALAVALLYGTPQAWPSSDASARVAVSGVHAANR